MSEETTDPKPWKCAMCGDRFVKDQRQPEAGFGHATYFAPRSAERLAVLAARRAARDTNS